MILTAKMSSRFCINYSVAVNVCGISKRRNKSRMFVREIYVTMYLITLLSSCNFSYSTISLMCQCVKIGSNDS